MTFSWLSDPSSTVGWTQRLAAMGVLIASLELLARPRALSDQGMLSWEVLQLRSRALVVGGGAWVLKRLFVPPGVYALCSLRALSAALLLLSSPASGWSLAALGVVTLTSLLLMLRTSYGNDGADQMLMLILVPTCLARLIGTPTALEFALWFIALQCTLSYFTSGLGKLAGASWRDGTGITGVLYTRTYGVAWLAQLLERHHWVAVALSWAVIVTEVAFGLVLVVPDPWVPLMLLGGLLFHLSNGVVMGLNSFVWAFGAAYPALAFLATRQGW